MAGQPNFLIVGAAKSGTTSLWHYLRQHPDVFMPVNKEPLFLAAPYYAKLNPDDPKYGLLMHHFVRDFEGYQQLFADAGDARALGEATAPYLYHHEMVIPRILRYLGDIPIVIILRNPTERAISAYTYLLRDGEEPRSLDECMDIEEERRRANWSMSHFYRAAGLYTAQVRAYLDRFSRVRIYLSEDLSNATVEVVQDLYEFLGVAREFVPDVSVRHNVSGVPTHVGFQRLLSNPNRLLNAIRPLARAVLPEQKRRRLVEGMRSRYLRPADIPPATRDRLQQGFRQDVLELEKLLDRDLGAWLE